MLTRRRLLGSLLAAAACSAFAWPHDPNVRRMLRGSDGRRYALLWLGTLGPDTWVLA